jgi:hypothetical protein
VSFTPGSSSVSRPHPAVEFAADSTVRTDSTLTTKNTASFEKCELHDMDIHVDGVYFLMDSSWWSRYEAEKNYHEDEFAPGPIDNSQLLNPSGQLKIELRRGIDYELVRPDAWHSLVDKYGGGPAVHMTNVGEVCVDLKAPSAQKTPLLSPRLVTTDMTSFGTWSRVTSYDDCGKVIDKTKTVHNL